VNHYEVLGVAPTASAEQVRRAYLRLAREHHPDRHGHSGPGWAEAEERMRVLNAAWAVLGDRDRRAAYDRQLSGEVPPARPGSGVHRPSSEFRPLDDGDDDDDLSWRHEPDPCDPRTAIGRWLSVGPAALVALGLGLMAVSFVVGVRALAAAALGCLLLGGVLFVGAPVVAVFRSRMAEERPAGRGSARR
jgi:hypothetical protein